MKRLRWAAVALAACGLGAQTAPKPILGTVTAFKVATQEFGVKPDNGNPVMVKVGPDTDVLAIPPGERGLEKARPAKVTDISLGDRVLVSYVDGLAEARRIVLISADEIARRNEAERLDWQQRGVSGTVASAGGGQIRLEQRSPGSVKTVVLMADEKTKVRRYAPDSVKFTDAQPSALAEIAVGDQVQARGRKGENGEVAVEEIVFGTFLTRLGKVTSVDAGAGVVRMEDLTTKKPLTVKVTASSRLKMLPDMRAMFAAMIKAGKEHRNAPGQGPAGEPFDMKKSLAQLPAAEIADVKVGTTIVVTSTRGNAGDELTAIMLLANADSLVQMAQAQAADKNMSPGEAISSMHGGALSGPGGLSLPAILQ